MRFATTPAASVMYKIEGSLQMVNEVKPDEYHNEQWLPISGYEGVYEVSNYGRIKRVLSEDNTFAGRILKGGDYHGYKFVQLSNKNVKSVLKIHRLVAAAFIGKPPDGKYNVNHIDGNPSNNHISNLEYVSQKENIHHAIKTGLISKNVTKPEKIKEIYDLLQQTNPLLTISEIARRSKVSQHVVYDVVRAKKPSIVYLGIQPTDHTNRQGWLTSEDKLEIKRLYKQEGMLLREIAAQYNIHLATVSKVINGRK